jgi:hypothetical protein
LTKRRAIHFAPLRFAQWAKTACGLVVYFNDPDFEEGQLTSDVDRVRCGNCESKPSFRRHVRDAETKLFRAVTGKPVRNPLSLRGRVAGGLRFENGFVMGRDVRW